MGTQLTAWGQFLTRHARAVLIAAGLLVVVMAAYGFGVFAALADGGFDDAGSDSAKELTVERALFGSHRTDIVAIYSSTDQVATDPAFQSAVDKVVARLDVPEVARVSTWYQTQAPTLISGDRHATAITITLSGVGQDELSDQYDTVAPLLRADGLRTQVGGQWAVFHDVSQTVAADIGRAESISMPIVLLLCLVIFGSLVAALMPVMVGAIAVIGAFAVVRLITTVADVSVFAINIITLLGMGLAIDYALFVVSRFREELARRDGTDRADVNAAVVATMSTAGRTVLFSGVTVAAALASLLVFPQVFLRSMGYGGMAAVLVAMAAALTVLPATLAVLGTRVNALALPRRQATLVGADSGQWARIAHAVMRRPVVWLVTIVVGLLALGSPILGVHWGSVDYRVLPSDAPSRVAIQRQIDQMGGEYSSAYVVVRGNNDVDAYADALHAVQGVADVQVLDRNVAESATLLQVSWPGNSQTQESQHLLAALRDVPPPTGASVVIGGTTAETVDLIDSVGEHLPWMAGSVVIIMMLLLFAAFGSVVLPIKAVVMNAVSIAASFGVVTWIFADGHLADLLGFTAHGYLDATQPILMLAVLFGLSMDYEVFLLSRVRERWDVSHDNEDAVATGVQHTGKIITSAAILLAVVIGAFSTSSIVFIKMIGVGMLVAVLVDATIVRLLLVPATMRLLGRLNWWAPAPLRRWYERHGIGESEPVRAQPSPVG